MGRTPDSIKTEILLVTEKTPAGTQPTATCLTGIQGILKGTVKYTMSLLHF